MTRLGEFFATLGHMAVRATANVPLEQIPTRGTREGAASAIMAETGCTRELAGRTIDWINGFVQQARVYGYEIQYPTNGQMATDEYRIFDRIMPHGAAPQPNSAADLVGQHLLDPALEETAILHSQTDEPGSPRYCTVQVSLSIIR